MTNSKPLLKNHVAKRGARLGQVLKTKFGFGLDDFRKALAGDQALIQRIGEASKQGRHAQEFAPLLEEAYLNIIRGTEVQNKSEANILKQAGSSGIAIDKAISQTLLASQKYKNQRSELAAEFAGAKAGEAQRHQYAINYLQLKSYIDLYIGGIDGQTRLIEQSNRPEFKQLDENQRYETAVSKHFLQHGDAAQPNLIPQKQYSLAGGGDKPGTSLGQKAKSFLTALGL